MILRLVFGNHKPQRLAGEGLRALRSRQARGGLESRLNCIGEEPSARFTPPTQKLFHSAYSCLIFLPLWL